MRYSTGPLTVYCPKCQVYLRLEQMDLELDSITKDRDLLVYSCPACGTQIATRQVLGVEAKDG